MRRWRKVIHRVVVYGLIGLVVNVAVAWGFAAWARAPTRQMSSVFTFGKVSAVEHADALEWSDDHPWLARSPLQFRQVGHGAGTRLLYEQGQDSGGNISLVVIARFGWPRLALRWREVTRDDGPGQVHSDKGTALNVPAWVPGARTPLNSDLQRVRRRLPFEPEWRGMAVNTAVMGAAAWMSGMLGAWARRAIRRRRGRCPLCAYDLRGDLRGGCSECGWGRARA